MCLLAAQRLCQTRACRAGFFVFSVTTEQDLCKECTIRVSKPLPSKNTRAGSFQTEQFGEFAALQQRGIERGQVPPFHQGRRWRQAAHKKGRQRGVGQERV